MRKTQKSATKGMDKNLARRFRFRSGFLIKKRLHSASKQFSLLPDLGYSNKKLDTLLKSNVSSFLGCFRVLFTGYLLGRCTRHSRLLRIDFQEFYIKNQGCSSRNGWSSAAHAISEVLRNEEAVLSSFFHQ